MPRLDPAALMLAPRHRQMPLDLLRRQLPTAVAWAYGSRVNGDGHEASDLDLVVRNPTDLLSETEGLDELRDALVESSLPIRVDLIDWARIPEAFRREIERAYVVVREGGDVNGSPFSRA
ncbi:MAG: nucleotidyltransferase domain-containing protein [Desulfuromonadales bacterium]|nr:nucleotidyltransferase domain-containing protein [Desulfuromonadales bacterium]